MMFGAWGKTDHDDCIRIHRALDAGVNFLDTADVVLARRVRGDRRQGARRRAARLGRARHEMHELARRTARIPSSSATRGAGSCGGREQPAAARKRASDSTSTRSTAPRASTTRHRRAASAARTTLCKPAVRYVVHSRSRRARRYDASLARAGHAQGAGPSAPRLRRSRVRRCSPTASEPPPRALLAVRRSSTARVVHPCRARCLAAGVDNVKRRESPGSCRRAR